MGNLNFKLRIVFLEYFFLEIWRSKKWIELSEKMPPLVWSSDVSWAVISELLRGQNRISVPKWSNSYLEYVLTLLLTLFARLSILRLLTSLLQTTRVAQRHKVQRMHLQDAKYLGLMHLRIKRFEQVTLFSHSK